MTGNVKTIRMFTSTLTPDDSAYKLILAYNKWRNANVFFSRLPFALSLSNGVSPNESNK